jgi:hypothetical protein
MFGFRYGAALVALLAAVSAGLVYQANVHLNTADKALSEAREATFHTYRIAQTIKSLIHGYELSINEYYSTALSYPSYQKKSVEFKLAMQAELSDLERLKAGDADTVADLKETLGEMENMRVELEGALASENKNWDLAREALYKLTLVSVRAAQPSDLLANVAEKRAIAMGAVWSDQQSQALLKMRIALLLVLGAGVLAILAVFRSPRNVPFSAENMA